MPPTDDVLRRGLALTLEGTSLSGLGTKYEGKVRDCYMPGDGRRILVTTDRISAFDRVLGTLPFKGQILNGLSAYWFETTKDVAPNHVLSIPDPNVTIAMDCVPLPVELVVRAYLTGVTSTSIWTHYARGERTIAGHRFPDGMKKNEPLRAPILTPSTKAHDGGHDVTVSKDELLAAGEISAADFETAAAMALALFEKGAAVSGARGLILADTKYEMGKRADGTIVVIDEIHTPDSSRYWQASSYPERLAKGEEPESFDKEYVRRWLAAQGFTGDGPIPPIPDDVRVEASRRYATASEQILGAPFVPDLSPAEPRIRASLGLR